MYKSALLTNILQSDNPGGLSNSRVREVIATAAALHVDAPGRDFMSRYQSHDVCISLDQLGDYGAGTSRASVLKRHNAGIHTVYIGLHHTMKIPLPTFQYDLLRSKLAIDQPGCEWRRFASLKPQEVEGVLFPTPVEDGNVRAESLGMVAAALLYHEDDMRARDIALAADQTRAATAPSPASADSTQPTRVCPWCESIDETTIGRHWAIGKRQVMRQNTGPSARLSGPYSAQDF